MTILERADLYKKIREQVISANSIDMTKAVLVEYPSTYAIPVTIDDPTFTNVYAKVAITGFNPESFDLEAAVKKAADTQEEKARKRVAREESKEANASVKLAQAAEREIRKAENEAYAKTIEAYLETVDMATIEDMRNANEELENLRPLRIGQIVARMIKDGTARLVNIEKGKKTFARA